MIVINMYEYILQKEVIQFYYLKWNKFVNRMFKTWILFKYCCIYIILNALLFNGFLMTGPKKNNKFSVLSFILIMIINIAFNFSVLPYYHKLSEYLGITTIAL